MSAATTTRASQLSGSTAINSTTSLNSLSGAVPAAPNGGQVVATSNIINQKADASRSLYQICVSLKQRLAQVPGFEGYSAQLDQMSMEEGGPVESLWKVLRTGRPLLTIYNALRPEQPLQIDEKPGDSDSKRSKIAILKFVEACKNQLQLPTDECFIISDLTGTDTTGFVKVTGVINLVLDLVGARGFLKQIQPYPEDDTMQVSAKMSYRDYIVRELVDTERKYVQDLENLYDLKTTLEQRGIVAGDIVHQIFLNINLILDFQRRFLIRVETTNSIPRDRQNWGAPFVANEEAFSIYQDFIANQRKAAQTAGQLFDKIQTANHPVACDLNTLGGFLLKPMQRLVKYPLLLRDLRKKSEDEEIKEELTRGIDAAERILRKANEAVNRDLLDEALEELVARVEDWKNHRVDQFGPLLLHGIYTVVTGKSDQEKDYEIYLFYNILLCCKEVTPNKSKDKKDKTKSTGQRVPNKNAKLQLKGRIFMSNVTDVVAISKAGSPGSYTVQIWWKGDPGVENFMIKFSNEEMMKKWANGLDQQRKLTAEKTAQSPDTAPLEFEWTRGLQPSENPYAQPDDDDDDDSYGSTPTTSQYGAPPALPVMPEAIQRNASSTSLRQRSATGDSSQSLASLARVPPPRFPLPTPPIPLSVQTQMGPVPSHPSPGPRGGDSYFSPVAESPTSSRTSTTSSMFPPSVGYALPTGAPQSGGWGTGEDYNRYTAPAMPRAPSREGPSPINAYGMVTMNGRNPRGPSMPVMPREPSQGAQQRSRSYSTPDINGQGTGRRPSQQSVPAIPSIPPHLTHERHDSTIPRSNSGSPANEPPPMRANTQSPGTQRTREQRGGTMSQFPTQPIHARQGTPANALPPPGPPPPGMAPLAPAPAAAVDSSRTASPAVGAAAAAAAAAQPALLASPEIPLPLQIKIKVNCDNRSYITLVAQFNITYQSLIDRIDTKLSRFTAASIGKGNLKLRYRDEDGDFVMIESDDDIQIAISEWREAMRNVPSGGEMELFCIGDMS